MIGASRKYGHFFIQSMNNLDSLGGLTCGNHSGNPLEGQFSLCFQEKGPCEDHPIPFVEISVLVVAIGMQASTFL